MSEKPLKRSTVHPMDRGGPHSLPDGSYHHGITDTDVLIEYGRFLSYWPHIEDRIIRCFAELLGITNAFDVRILFFTFVNQKARIDIMKSLLEHSPRNAKKGSAWDRVISEFAALNNIRNAYVHGVWKTQHLTKENKNVSTVWLSEASKNDIYFLKVRKVTKKEFEDNFKRMTKFERFLIEMA